MYIMLDIIPSRFENELRDDLKKKYVSIDEKFTEMAGIPFRKMMLLGVAVLLRMKYAAIRHVLPKLKVAIEGCKSLPLLKADRCREFAYKTLAEDSKTLGICLSLDPKALVPADAPVSESDVSHFLSYFSKTFQYICGLNHSHPHNIGYVSSQYHPLERYPIVRTGDQLLIPNLRMFENAITDSLIYNLSEFVGGDSVRMTLGKVQEYVIYMAVEESNLGLITIPELKYTLNGAEAKGPDLTIIDGNTVIMIESKATMIWLETRVNNEFQEFADNLKSIMEAVETLQNVKLEKVLDCEGEYAGYPQLKSIKGENVILVGVVNGEYHSLHEIAVSAAKSVGTYPSSGFKNPYCLMSLQTFIMAIEVAKQSRSSLSAVLLNYHKVAENNDPKTHPSDAFEGFELEAEDTFLKKYYHSLVNSLRTEAV